MILMMLIILCFWTIRNLHGHYLVTSQFSRQTCQPLRLFRRCFENQNCWILDCSYFAG